MTDINCLYCGRKTVDNQNFCSLSCCNNHCVHGTLIKDPPPTMDDWLLSAQIKPRSNPLIIRTIFKGYSEG